MATKTTKIKVTLTPAQWAVVYRVLLVKRIGTVWDKAPSGKSGLTKQEKRVLSGVEIDEIAERIYLASHGTGEGAK